MNYKVTFTGLVQGVGFRPFLYRQAAKYGWHGYVKNTGQGVELVINKKTPVNKILRGQPLMSRIDSVEIKPLRAKSRFKNFAIRPSVKRSGQSEIPPDIFLCPDCLKELRDPKNRRHGYFFITCTNCGPRYTITAATPYDRAQTSMAKFSLCPQCAREYHDPLNRRYHAETIACPKCGPRLSLWHKQRRVPTNDPIAATAKLLKQGKIVAIKGIGGFHLVCSAKPAVVRKLRRLSGRPHKPFALLVKDMAAAKKLVRLNKLEREILVSPQRPIVVAQKKRRATLRAVSELDSLGLMLPYTGLHYLLFDYINEPLVFTSSNLPGRPLTTKRAEQFVPDVLDHNRPIVNAIDDSVIKVVNNHPLFLRKARGYMPDPMVTASQTKSGRLALGAEQNSTFALDFGRKIILSPYLGQTQIPATLKRYQQTLQKFTKFYHFQPSEMFSDRHPDYATTKYGIKLVKKWRIPLTPVQHHLAHVLSVAAEHDLDEFIGIAADGAGYGMDGKIWGGEVFHVKRFPHLQWQRLASLEEQPLIGGDLAALDTPRLVLGVLAKFMDERQLWPIMKRFYTQNQFRLLLKQLKSGLNVTATTSAGRVLDSAVALLGFCTRRTYEGEPALVLEANSGVPKVHLRPVISPARYGDSRKFVLETTPLFRYLLDHWQNDKRQLAAVVQDYLAQGFLALAKKVNLRLPIVFSGGVAYNRIITTYLTDHGVLVNKKIPPGDGGISFGQLQY